jgi:hypothetical protein
LATLEKQPSERLDPSKRLKSPFFARTYGGFTTEQEAFYLPLLGQPRKKIVLDPMAGQGFLLGALAGQGAEIWLGDIDPAPLHLGLLRDPRLILQRAELVAWFKKWFAPFAKSGKRLRVEYFDDWVLPEIGQELRRFAARLELKPNVTPFSYRSNFWTSPLPMRFAACLPILAARSISCFRGSDNITWLKRGGLVRENSIYGPILTALDLWEKYANDVASTYTSRQGRISVRRMDAEKGLFANSKLADLIITSPPYANRLDYTRMWAPELEVLSAMWAGNSNEIKVSQIGSTVIEGKDATPEDEAILPRTIRRVLEEIRNDAEWRASESYYYPFFRNYAISLARSLRHVALRLRPGGTLIIFVRDTVRKDIMFPTADLIKRVLVHDQGMREVSRRKLVLRSHVGLLRKGAAGGVYGLAQLEWWLAFRKE